MFNSPIKSSKLDIYVVDKLCNNYICCYISNIKKKLLFYKIRII